MKIFFRIPLISKGFGKHLLFSFFTHMFNVQIYYTLIQSLDHYNIYVLSLKLYLKIMYSLMGPTDINKFCVVYN